MKCKVCNEILRDFKINVEEENESLTICECLVQYRIQDDGCVNEIEIV